MRTLVEGRTVQEAATMLGVGRARVQALIASGDLVAEDVGGRWIVPEAHLARYRRIPRVHGRHLNPSSAWDQIDRFESGERDPSDLKSMWGALAARSTARLGRMLPERLGTADCPVKLEFGGAHAASRHGAAVRSAPTDVYVSGNDVDELVAWSGFASVTSNPNVVLHAVQNDCWARLRGGIPLAAAWLDLADAGDRGASEVMFEMRRRRGA